MGGRHKKDVLTLSLNFVRPAVLYCFPLDQSLETLSDRLRKESEFCKRDKPSEALTSSHGVPPPTDHHRAGRLEPMRRIGCAGKIADRVVP